LPEERAFSKVIQQIKQGHASYPLFGLARMFLERPERHRVRIRSLNDTVMMYQLGDDGPVAMEMSALERIAFNEKKDDFYTSEIVEKEPIKGNFTSVARCGLSGRLLGPTNYHTFQKVIRSLYEQRFSRRMSFEEYRRSIEITSDPDAVNQWKEEARKVVTYSTKDQENPVSFESVAAMEQHFRTNHLENLIKPCLAAEVSGDVARHLPDRSIIAAIRRARERENRFPAQMAGALRHGLNQAGLHVFKHKKRILYISTIRPQLFDPNQARVSPGLEAILATLRSYPRITRKQLAEKVLKRLLGEKSADEHSTEYLQAKNSLPTDLLWLAKAGHVIEFADGTLDLPLPPRAVEKPGTAQESAGQEEAASEEQSETESATDVPVTEEPPTEVEAASEVSAEHVATEQQTSVEEHALVEHQASAEELAVLEHQASVEEHALVEHQASAEEHAPVEHHASAEEHAVVEHHASAEEHALVEHQASAEELAVLEHQTSAEEHALVEHQASAEEHALLEHQASAEEHAVVEHQASAEEHALVEHQASAEELAVLEHQASAEELAVLEHQASAEELAVLEHQPSAGERHTSGETHISDTEHEVHAAENVVTEAPPSPEPEVSSREQPEAKVEPTKASHSLTSAAPEHHESSPNEPTTVTDSHDNTPTNKAEWATAGK
jgi:UDP-3-O-[3-hydroxymyristoyl] glucosamine N-acyltransferase